MRQTDTRPGYWADMTPDECCHQCGARAYHRPVTYAGNAYCCQCYNHETPCPDPWCDSHNDSPRALSEDTAPPADGGQA